MRATYDSLPWDERTKYIEATEQAIQAGTFDPLPEYVGLVRRRNQQTFHRTIGGGITGAIAGAVALGGVLALPLELIALSGGGILALVVILAWDRRTAIAQAIEDGEIGEYLTEAELRELDDLRLSLKPTTEKAKRSLKRINAICEAYLEVEEEEDAAETVDVAAETVPPPATAALTENTRPDAPGVNTQLNALTVGATPIPAIPRFDIRSLAGELLRSIIWIGYSQSGKTTTADQLGRALRARLPKMKAYYLTPVYRDAGGNDERRLFDWCDQCLRFNLLNETDQSIITAAYQQYDDLLVEWMRLPHSKSEPKLFIADELTLHCINAVGTRVKGKQVGAGNAMALQFFGRLINAFNSNASGGSAVGVALWGLSPSGAVDGIGFNQNTLSASLAIFIANTAAWNGTVHKLAANNSLAPNEAPTHERLASWAKHDVERIISVGAKDWAPLADNPVPRGAPEPLERPLILSQPIEQPIQPRLNGEAEPPDVKTAVAVSLPVGVTDQIAAKILALVMAWMERNEDKLPVAQSNLACANQPLKRVFSKLKKDGWIRLLKYWESVESITLEETQKGLKVGLPTKETELSWDDIFNSD